MKIYGVTRWYSQPQENDKCSFANMRQWDYVGPYYDKAMSVYKQLAKWNSATQFISFDATDIKDMTADTTVKESADLVKLACKYHDVIRGLGDVRSDFVKDGKITIVLQKDYYYEFMEGRDRPVINRYTVMKETYFEALKCVTDKWIADNNITVPFKVNCDGKTICKYNQK